MGIIYYQLGTWKNTNTQFNWMLEKSIECFSFSSSEFWCFSLEMIFTVHWFLVFFLEFILPKSQFGTLYFISLHYITFPFFLLQWITIQMLFADSLNYYYYFAGGLTVSAILTKLNQILRLILPRGSNVKFS